MATSESKKGGLERVLVGEVARVTEAAAIAAARLRGRGDEKLAASAARPVALAARRARRARALANRAALAQWRVGAQALISPQVRVLGGTAARVVGLGRSRLVIEIADGRRYHITPGLLIPAV